MKMDNDRPVSAATDRRIALLIDADFTPLVMQLKANGHEVYGFGARKTPVPFVNACTTFLYLEGLGDPAPASPVADPPAMPSAEVKSVSKGGSKSGGVAPKHLA